MNRKEFCESLASLLDREETVRSVVRSYENKNPNNGRYEGLAETVSVDLGGNNKLVYNPEARNNDGKPMIIIRGYDHSGNPNSIAINEESALFLSMKQFFDLMVMNQMMLLEKIAESVVADQDKLVAEMSESEFNIDEPA
jgi:hypothetical protein